MTAIAPSGREPAALLGQLLAHIRLEQPNHQPGIIGVDTRLGCYFIQRGKAVASAGTLESCQVAVGRPPILPVTREAS